MATVQSPHVLILPYPAQGHVIPLMELSYLLLDHGFKVTFVHTEFNHDRVVRSTEIDSRIQVVTVPDGMAPGEDRNNFASLCESMLLVMPNRLEQLIRKINGSELNSTTTVTWMIADQSMAWAFRVAKKMGIKAAAFWPAASATLAVLMSIPKLIEEGLLHNDGTPITQGVMINLIPDMPPMDPRRLPWNLTSDPELQKIIYQYILSNARETNLADFIISNSFEELESATFAYMPNIWPIGPILTDEQLNKPTGQFWAEDASCMRWLDEQPANSVIYVAFGSIAILNQSQFRELALGLEQSGRPFLWVVRHDLTDDNAYPAGFQDRVAAGRGRMVGWSPQQKVLAHPSVACFVTHCGWNSTIEGVANGVPFLCWPYFADQFLNQSYICDVWRVGLKLTPDDDSGIISSGHIKVKVEELLGDEDLKARSSKLKETAYDNIREGGSSYRNMNIFINAMKE